MIRSITRPARKGGALLRFYPSICAMSFDAFVPRARAISINSSTCSPRSPASNFQTNESDLFSLAASWRCVRPAAWRAATTAAISALCFALRRCFKVVPPNWRQYKYLQIGLPPFWSHRMI